jgi:hypothetical protein
LDKTYGIPKPDKPDERTIVQLEKESKTHENGFSTISLSLTTIEARSKGINLFLALFYAFCDSGSSDERCLLTSNLTPMRGWKISEGLF